MNLSLLQTLTWSTVAGAVVSALALAATEPGASVRDRPEAAAAQEPLALPDEPSAAGPARPAASAPEFAAAGFAAR